MADNLFSFQEFSASELSALAGGLLLCDGLGPRIRQELFACFLRKGIQELVLGLESLRKKGSSEAFSEGKSSTGKEIPPLEIIMEQGQKLIESLGEKSIGHLTLGTPEYPPLLAEIADPPLLLFYRGRSPSQIGPAVSVVGTRAPNPQGESMAWKIGAALAQAGAAVVSGMARGIDSIAHTGCLDQGGFTLAVCGTGVDVIYPAENFNLAQRILETGSLVSEFLPGTRAVPSNFPRRNRIISGLSQALVVVQASRRSGSLITARLAAEQGREVLALPGDIFTEQYEGNNFLIRNGEARLVRNAADVVEDVNVIFSLQKRGWHLDTSVSCGNNKDIPAHGNLFSKSDQLSKSDHLTELIRDGDTIDGLVRRTGLGVSEVMTIVAELEMIGRVKRRSDGAIFISGLGRFE